MKVLASVEITVLSQVLLMRGASAVNEAAISSFPLGSLPILVEFALSPLGFQALAFFLFSLRF